MQGRDQLPQFIEGRRAELAHEEAEPDIVQLQDMLTDVARLQGRLRGVLNGAIAATEIR